jgi:methyltransferase-like protein
MAQAFPESEFVGIDLSAVAIEEGQATIAGAGLTNATLHRANIADVDERFGEFDYIITHGVFCWVPADVQRHILKVCQEQLAPNGVAYISYNTYPGWHVRGMIRDMMLYRSKCLSGNEPSLREAVELIDFLSKITPTENNLYGMLLAEELKQLKDKDEYYLVHEFLEENNRPCYFHEFMSMASGFDLQYLGESDFSMMSVDNFSREVSVELRQLASDVIQMEQYMDFVRNRLFRQTLLCHANVKLDRNVRPERLFDLLIASSARPESTDIDPNDQKEVVFRRPGSALTTAEPLMKAAMLTLLDAWPTSLSFHELLERTRSRLEKGPMVLDAEMDRRVALALAAPLLRCFSTTLVDLATHCDPPMFTTPELLRVSPLIRYQAANRQVVTNLMHQPAPLTDLHRHVLALLDGTNGRTDLLVDLEREVQAGRLVLRDQGRPVLDPDRMRALLGGILDQCLNELAVRGVFSTPSG